MEQINQLVDINDSLSNKYLTFDIDNQMFGLDIQYVIEIIGMQGITTVPNLPRYIQGIINLRGKVVPIIDLRYRFGKPSKPYDKRTCIVVIEMDKDVVGLIVDGIYEVRNIPKENISNASQQKQTTSNQFLEGIAQYEGQICLILNCNSILYN